MKKTEGHTENVYPKFLDNKPCGKTTYCCYFDRDDNTNIIYNDIVKTCKVKQNKSFFIFHFTFLYFLV